MGKKGFSMIELIVVLLLIGVIASIGFPRLRNATRKQRAHWQLIGDGIGIHWPEVDEDIEVESLRAT